MIEKCSHITVDAIYYVCAEMILYVNSTNMILCAYNISISIANDLNIFLSLDGGFT